MGQPAVRVDVGDRVHIGEQADRGGVDDRVGVGRLGQGLAPSLDLLFAETDRARCGSRLPALSRAFRQRFGAAPRDWRAAQGEAG